MFHGNKNTVFGIKISRLWLGIRIHVYPSTCQWANIISLSNTRVYQLTLIYNLLNDAATQRLAISLGTVYGGYYRVGGATDQQLIWSRPPPPQESHLYQFADTFSPSKITENSLPVFYSHIYSIDLPRKAQVSLLFRTGQAVFGMATYLYISFYRK